MNLTGDDSDEPSLTRRPVTTLEAAHRTCLRLCGLLRHVDSADFATMASLRDLSGASRSETVAKLTELGYVTVQKRASSNRADARRVTSLSLTPLGHQAFDSHVAALRDLATAP